MSGPNPKPQGTRQRRNTASTKTVLTAVDPESVVIPDLPAVRPWHARTVDHWNDIWNSPMAPEFDMAADFRGLVLLAEIWDGFYIVSDDIEMPLEKQSRLKMQLAGEIRLQEQRFGLSPRDRRRLQWEIDRGDEALGRTQKRRNQKLRTVAEGETDPRDILTG